MDMQFKHTDHMGILVANLQSLEFAIRSYLYNKDIHSKQQKSEFDKKIYDFKEGDEVEENAFTNYDTLGELIGKYNRVVESIDTSLCIDKERIVNVRDALAHGRIARESPSAHMPQKLIKYDKPSNGKVRVTHCFAMTKDWFGEQIRLVRENVQRIVRANEKRLSQT
jgi:hypothetical protein